MIAVASFGPMPGTASNSALGASRIASEEPNRSISAWYVFVPIPLVMCRRRSASNSVNAVSFN